MTEIQGHQRRQAPRHDEAAMLQSAAELVNHVRSHGRQHLPDAALAALEIIDIGNARAVQAGAPSIWEADHATEQL